MSEESTTPDLVELTRRQLEAANRRDLEEEMSRCPPDGVYDTSPDGLVVYKGPAAIRGFIDEWWAPFEELALEPEDILDLGHGIRQTTVYTDIDEGRAAAEQLAEERG